MKLSTKGCIMQCTRRARSLWQKAAIEIAWLAGSWPAVHCANNKANHGITLQIAIGAGTQVQLTLAQKG